MGKFKVSEEDCRGMFVEIANTVFNQAWVLESDFSETEKVDEDVDGKKRRRVTLDLALQFPSRGSLRTWMEAAAVLNLRHVALLLKHKPDSVVATLGLDDATKAAGYKTYDVKASHLTLKSKDTEKRDVYTTGYMENASHSPEDAAANIKCTIEMLAILAGCTQDEIKDSLDFWMSDRAGDVEPTLDILGVEKNKRIRCCAHILLCIDEAINRKGDQAEGAKNWSGKTAACSERKIRCGTHERERAAERPDCAGENAFSFTCKGGCVAVLIIHRVPQRPRSKERIQRFYFQPVWQKSRHCGHISRHQRRSASIF